MSQLVDDCVFAFDWQSDANQSVVGRRDDDRPERRVVSFTTSHRAIVATGSTDGSPAAALRAVEHPRVRAQSSALRRSGSTAPGSHLTSAAPPVLRAWAPPTDTGGKGRETGAIRPTPALRAPRPNCLARDVAVVVDWPATCASWLKPANRLTPPGRRRVGHRRPSTRLVTDEPTTGPALRGTRLGRWPSPACTTLSIASHSQDSSKGFQERTPTDGRAHPQRNIPDWLTPPRRKLGMHDDKDEHINAPVVQGPIQLGSASPRPG